MIPDSLIYAVSRSFERLLIDAFFGTSLVLGWQLFHSGVLKDQSADFSGKGWRIRLLRVGPGVFFALFGAAGLVFAVRQPLSVDISSGASAEHIQHYNYVLGDTSQLRDRVYAVSTIEQLVLPTYKANTELERQAVSRAAAELTEEKNTLMRAQFPTTYDWYLSERHHLQSEGKSPDDLQPDEKDHYEAIDRVFNTTFLALQDK